MLRRTSGSSNGGCNARSKRDLCRPIAFSTAFFVRWRSWFRNRRTRSRWDCGSGTTGPSDRRRNQSPNRQYRAGKSIDQHLCAELLDDDVVVVLRVDQIVFVGEARATAALDGNAQGGLSGIDCESPRCACAAAETETFALRSFFTVLRGLLRRSAADCMPCICRSSYTIAKNWRPRSQRCQQSGGWHGYYNHVDAGYRFRLQGEGALCLRSREKPRPACARKREPDAHAVSSAIATVSSIRRRSGG